MENNTSNLYHKLQNKISEVMPLKAKYIKAKVEDLNEIIEQLESVGIVIRDSESPDFFIAEFSYNEEGIWAEFREG